MRQHANSKRDHDAIAPAAADSYRQPCSHAHNSHTYQPPDTCRFSPNLNREKRELGNALSNNEKCRKSPELVLFSVPAKPSKLFWIVPLARLAQTKTALDLDRCGKNLSRLTARNEARGLFCPFVKKLQMDKKVTNGQKSYKWTKKSRPRTAQMDKKSLSLNKHVSNRNIFIRTFIF